MCCLFLRIESCAVLCCHGLTFLASRANRTHPSVPTAGSTYTVSTLSNNTFSAPAAYFFRPGAWSLLGFGLTAPTGTCTATVPSWNQMMPQFSVSCSSPQNAVFVGSIVAFDFLTGEYSIAVNLNASSTASPAGVRQSVPGVALTALFKAGTHVLVSTASLIGAAGVSANFSVLSASITPTCLSIIPVDPSISYFFKGTLMCVMQWNWHAKDLVGPHRLNQRCINTTSVAAGLEHSFWLIPFISLENAAFINTQVQGSSFRLDTGAVYSRYAPTSTALIGYNVKFSNTAGACVNFTSVGGSTRVLSVYGSTVLGPHAGADANVLCTMTLGDTNAGGGCCVDFTFVCGSSTWLGILYPNMGANGTRTISNADATAVGAFTTVVNQLASNTQYPISSSTLQSTSYQETFIPNSLSNACSASQCLEGYVCFLITF
jgi:hypothetical protein